MSRSKSLNEKVQIAKTYRHGGHQENRHAGSGLSRWPFSSKTMMKKCWQGRYVDPASRIDITECHSLTTSRPATALDVAVTMGEGIPR